MNTLSYIPILCSIIYYTLPRTLCSKLCPEHFLPDSLSETLSPRHFVLEYRTFFPHLDRAVPTNFRFILNNLVNHPGVPETGASGAAVALRRRFPEVRPHKFLPSHRKLFVFHRIADGSVLTITF